jgi:hypothetical protein
MEPGNISFRRADVRDTDIVVRILIASKEASFPIPLMIMIGTWRSGAGGGVITSSE